MKEEDRRRAIHLRLARMGTVPGRLTGLALSAIGYFVNPAGFFRAYLPSFLFWFSIVAGSLAVLMLQYVTGGEWGLMIRRPLGASARTMLVMLVFFIPVAVGMLLGYIYPWTDHAVMTHDPVLSQKIAWLNPTGWLIRSAFYFALWILWAWC